ncbi:MAG: hypothetical protein ACKO6A_08480 [Bacteroidota bacterium]
MLGRFISKHGIKIAVFLLIVGALYNYTGRNPSEINGYKSVPIYGNTIMYKGDISEKNIQNIGNYLEQIGVFSKDRSLIFIIDAKTEIKQGLVILSILIDATKINNAVKTEAAKIWIDLKKAFFSNVFIKGCFVDNKIQPIKCYTEDELKAILSISSYMKETEKNEKPNTLVADDNYKEKSWTVNEIITKWEQGATKISKAQHFIEINNNNEWRIYYEEQYSEYANTLAKIIFENQFVKKDYLDYFAFFAAPENELFNGEMTYYFAIPFNEQELKNGTAENTASRYYSLFKKEYMKNVNFVVALCDYDFNIIRVQAK